MNLVQFQIIHHPLCHFVIINAKEFNFFVLIFHHQNNVLVSTTFLEWIIAQCVLCFFFFISVTAVCLSSWYFLLMFFRALCWIDSSSAMSSKEINGAETIYRNEMITFAKISGWNQWSSIFKLNFLLKVHFDFRTDFVQNCRLCGLP